ncbi:MAG: D-aminoacyl-tRNA deacylase [Candidatus Methanomethylophilaceae archaeon]|jgi:D-aminoacyl-tRNA deacylase
MERLLICTESDPPSVNMRDSLEELGEWEPIGSKDGTSVVRCGSDYIMSSKRWHVEFEDVLEVAGRFGVHPDLTVFMSRHSSESKKPVLTVHPIGNYHGNDLGGKEKTLVKSAPAPMSAALRSISALNDIENMDVSFEVTHHGPWLDCPVFFIEVGSGVPQWGNKHAAEILALALMNYKEENYPVAVGVGGGHYAPRFTEAVLGRKVDIGHMIPNYQLDGRDREDIARMMREACSASDTKTILLHRKSMKGVCAAEIKEIAESEGFEVASSSDFEELGQ